MKSSKLFGAGFSAPGMLCVVERLQALMTSMACHVCGYELDDPPWGPDGLSASFHICACCGLEFGYEDCSESGVIAHRERWKNSGYRWFGPRDRPPGWDPQDQMKNIPTSLPAGIDRDVEWRKMAEE